MGDELEDLCRELELPFKSHDSHGYYLEVWIGKKWFMLDPTPDNIWKGGQLLKQWPDKVVVVRDRTHHYNRQTHLKVIERVDAWIDELRVFLTEGYLDARPIDSQTGQPL